MRVVRPGQDAEAVLDEAREQLAASSGRRRRRGVRGGRGGGRSTGGSTMAPQTSEQQVQDSLTPEPEPPLLVEITPLEMAPVPEAAVSISLPNVETSEDEAPQDTNSNGEETRLGRRRRRSSATDG